ncbi:MAG: hypothetical protein U9R23_08080 [Candidatus Cloacimonadota bacterium]|nr:hypothetical protein [Candidatus Cloacimonadota bacterium]
MWILTLSKEINDRKLYKKLKNIADKYDRLEFDEYRGLSSAFFQILKKI